MCAHETKEKEVCCCCCGEDSGAGAAEQTPSVQGAAIKILGGGCDKCRALERNTLDALYELGMEPAVEHVTDLIEIARYGVLEIPALVYNDKVLSSGKVLKPAQICKLLRQQ